VSDRPFVPPSRVSARNGRAGTKGRDEGTTARAGISGRLAPWADPVTGTLGWQVTTPSRRLAVLVAETESAAAVSAHEWQVHIPQAALTVAVMKADTAALHCTLSIHPHSEVFILAFAPWPAATVLKCSLAALPARGTLSVRDVRTTTRMGRIVRYLVPEFIPP
jgi:hypothetical protein